MQRLAGHVLFIFIFGLEMQISYGAAPDAVTLTQPSDANPTKDEFARFSDDDWKKYFESLEARMLLAAQNDNALSFSFLSERLLEAVESYNIFRPAPLPWYVRFTPFSHIFQGYRNDSRRRIIEEDLQTKLEAQGIPKPPSEFNSSDQLVWYSSWLSDSPRWSTESWWAEYALNDHIREQLLTNLEALKNSGKIPPDLVDRVVEIELKAKSGEHIHATLSDVLRELQALDIQSQFSQQAAISPRAVAGVSTRKAMKYYSELGFAQHCRLAVKELIEFRRPAK